MENYKILVVNDDGIEAEGIRILSNALKKYGNVTVCAPDKGRSAASHSITIKESLKFEKIDKIEDVECYKINGTPADCVRVATSVLGNNFDLVFSGVNEGLNLGTDAIYSGTVAAAREAHIEYLPSIAISAPQESFSIVAKEIDQLLEKIFTEKLFSKEYTLNINFPTKEFKDSKGIVFARQGVKRFKTEYQEIKSKEFKGYKDTITYDKNVDTDVYLAYRGYITITPLKVDQTDYEMLKKWQNQ